MGLKWDGAPTAANVCVLAIAAALGVCVCSITSALLTLPHLKRHAAHVNGGAFDGGAVLLQVIPRGELPTRETVKLLQNGNFELRQLST